MIKAIEIQAPNEIPNTIKTKVFLAGSICGKKEGEFAIEWQKEIIKLLEYKPLVFLNPRRDNWDSTWVQDIKNKEFKEQVKWELTSLELADFIIMVIDPNTYAPITLLELGLHARSNKLVVICPEGFWKKGNVDVVCEVYNIPLFSSIEELIVHIDDYIH